MTVAADYSLYTLSSSSDVESVRYVGITKNPSQRIKGHLKAAKDNSKSNHRVRWIRSVVGSGSDVCMIVIEGGLSEEVALRNEVRKIAELRSAGCDLVNSTDGGDGVRGYVFTPEDRRKISLAGMGRKNSPESIERTASAHRGKIVSEETRKKISDAASNISEETRKKMSVAAQNCSTEKRDKIAKRVSEINRMNPPLRGGYKGVTYKADMRKKWRARINSGGSERVIGYFHTPEEAAMAYDAAATEAFGAGLCYVNFPESLKKCR